MHCLPFFFTFIYRGALGLLLAAGVVAAQAQVSVTASLSQNQVAAGDQVQLTIQIRGANRLPQQPDLVIPRLEINPSGASQATQIDGNTGQVQIFATYTYMVSAESPGDYEIPALDVTIEGQVYKTEALKLKVTAGNPAVNPADDPFRPILKLETTKSEVYESEVVGLTITLMIHQGVNIRELPFPTLPRENFAMKRFQRNPDNGPIQFNGALYRAFYFRTSVSAIKAGELVLGPAEVKMDLEVPDGSGRRDPFGFMNAKLKNYKIKSEPLMIKVKPLPETGKPANFSGAVGKFTTQIQAQPLKVVQGDPIAATLYVNGVGNFESLAAPAMEASDGWRQYAAKQVQENRTTGLDPGSVVYSQVLIPDKVQTQIPSFVLNFFNPDSGQYEVARTDVIPVQVIPNPNSPNGATAGAGTVGTGIRDFSFEGKDLPKEDLVGALSVLRTPGTLLSLQAAPFTLRYPWLVHGVGGACLLTMLTIAYRRRSGQRQVREVKTVAPPKAAEVFRQLKGEHGSLRQFYTLAADFLAARQREGVAPPLPDSAQAEVAKRVILRRDFFSYGTADAASQPVPDSEYHEVVDALKQW